MRASTVLCTPYPTNGFFQPKGKARGMLPLSDPRNCTGMPACTKRVREHKQKHTRTRHTTRLDISIGGCCTSTGMRMRIRVARAILHFCIPAHKYLPRIARSLLEAPTETIFPCVYPRMRGDGCSRACADTHRGRATGTTKQKQEIH
jgi:hypothetical protein